MGLGIAVYHDDQEETAEDSANALSERVDTGFCPKTAPESAAHDFPRKRIYFA